MPAQNRQGVLEIHLRLTLVGLGLGTLQLDLAVVGEKTRQGDQHEMRIQFLFHATFGLAVKLLDRHHLLRNLVHLFNSPAAVVGVRQDLDGIAAVGQQGGRQGVGGAAMAVFHQPQGIAWKLRLTRAAAQAATRVTPGDDLNLLLGMRAFAEAFHQRRGIFFTRKIACTPSARYYSRLSVRSLVSAALAIRPPTGSKSARPRAAANSMSENNMRCRSRTSGSDRFSETGN